ncbi:MAG: RNA-binding protein [Anaerolineales bacterium]|nr:RNA-binding protein [Anaerolineales bacterium]
METKLYVGNLSYTTTEDDLRTLFTQAGTVKSVLLIKDRDSGRSKGFAFVEMETQAEVEKAIAQFNGSLFDERTINVNIARPREELGRKSYGGGRGGGNWQGNRPRGGDKGGRRRP